MAGVRALLTRGWFCFSQPIFNSVESGVITCTAPGQQLNYLIQIGWATVGVKRKGDDRWRDGEISKYCLASVLLPPLPSPPPSSCLSRCHVAVLPFTFLIHLPPLPLPPSPPSPHQPHVLSCCCSQLPPLLSAGPFVWQPSSGATCRGSASS